MNWKRLFLLAFVIWAGWHSWANRSVSHPAGILLNEDPRQSETQATPFKQSVFTLTPRAHFEIAARVLSRERYFTGREADLSPLDLALGWGQMSDTEVLEQIKISQSGRFYFWHTDHPPIPLHDITTHSANMHMIPANNYVREQLLALQQGQLVRLDAQLVDIDSKDGWRWHTSLTREDSGAGACEILWVEHVTTLKQ